MLYFQTDCDFEISIIEGDTILKCENDSALVSTDIIPGATYLWSNGDTSSSTFSKTTGQLIVTVDSLGCIAKDTIFLIPSSQGDTSFFTLCNGSTFTLPNGGIVSAAGLFSDTILSISMDCDTILFFDISISSNISTSVTDSICPSGNYTLPGGSIVSSAGTYTDTLLSTNGCDSVIMTTLVNKISNFFITTLNPISICEDDLPASVFGIAQNMAGIYFDTIVNTSGCDSIFSQQLILNSSQNDTTSFITICEGDSFLINGNYYSQSGSFFTDTTTGINGCDLYNVINITIVPNPNPDLGLDLTLDQGEEVSIEIQNPNITEDYTWSNSLGETYSGVIIEGNNQSSAEYYVLAINQAGSCLGYDSIRVFINELEDLVLLIPTGFTPNGDGINDEFGIVNYQDYDLINLKVYNRWGELVFSDTESNPRWDGTYKNTDQALELYIYYVEATPKNGKEKTIATGNITLIR